jgi:hypothetical protein
VVDGVVVHFLVAVILMGIVIAFAGAVSIEVFPRAALVVNPMLIQRLLKVTRVNKLWPIPLSPVGPGGLGFQHVLELDRRRGWSFLGLADWRRTNSSQRED